MMHCTPLHSAVTVFWLSMAQQCQNVKFYNRVPFAGWLVSKLATLKQLLRADRCTSWGLQTFGGLSSTGWHLQGELDWWNYIHGLLWSRSSAGGRDFPVQKNVLVAELRWCQDKVALMGWGKLPRLHFHADLSLSLCSEPEIGTRRANVGPF